MTRIIGTLRVGKPRSFIGVGLPLLSISTGGGSSTPVNSPITPSFYVITTDYSIVFFKVRF